MAQLFVRDEDGRWAVLTIESGSFLLSVHPPRRIDDPKKLKSLHSQVLLVPGRDERWLLQWGPLQDVRVNGLPQTLGLRVLEHRDEIKVGRVDAVYFSNEKLARIEGFPDSERALPCARCKTPITGGAPAVQCPQCGVWYHQTDDHPCWTYTERCVSFCTQPTALDAGLRWTPED